jgi:hypothetical protein
VPYVYFLFVQGERDANPDVATDPAVYRTRYDTLISTWTATFGGQPTWATYYILRDCYPNEPLINGVFDDLEVAYNKFKVLPTKDVTDIGDGLHHDYAGHKIGAESAMQFYKQNLGVKVESAIN